MACAQHGQRLQVTAQATVQAQHAQFWRLSVPFRLALVARRQSRPAIATQARGCVALKPHIPLTPLACVLLLNVCVSACLQVQHRGLREASAIDLATIEFLVKAVKAVAPDFDYQWLVEESQENLPMGGCISQLQHS